MTVVEELARFSANLKLATLPAGVVHAARRALLDTLGVAIAGASDPAASAARRAYEGSAGPSTAIGGSDIQAEAAALCNGVAAHSPEMDDFHRAATIHPGAVVVPAALAVGQEEQVDGARLLESVIAGYEVAIRLGLATQGSLYGHGFHPTGTLGVFGAAAAAAHAMALDAAPTAHALALAGTQASGLLAYKARGDWSKRLQAGNAAAQGVGAARLAAAGFLGPIEVFEGRFGFLSAYARGESCAQDALDQLDDRFHIGDVSFKPYASCRFTHAPIDALLAAMRKGDVQPAEIRRIDVAVHAQAIASVMVPAERKYRPKTPVDAQFSLPYCLAVAALNGQAPPEAFKPEALGDHATLELAARVAATEDPTYTALFPGQNASRVSVQTDRGTFTAELLDARGDPAYPLSDTELEGKFVALAQSMLGGEIAGRSLAGVLWHLDEQTTLEPVVAPLRVKLAAS